MSTTCSYSFRTRQQQRLRDDDGEVLDGAVFVIRDDRNRRVCKGIHKGVRALTGTLINIMVPAWDVYPKPKWALNSEPTKYKMEKKVQQQIEMCRSCSWPKGAGSMRES